MSYDRRWLGWLAVALALAPGGCAAFGGRSTPSTVAAADKERPRDVEQASFEDTPTYFDEEETDWWESLYPTNWSKAAKSSYQKLTGTEPNPAAAKQLYAEAEASYREAFEATASAGENSGKKISLLIAAGDKYAEAAERWPSSALEQDGLYMAAESYFFADAYPKATEYYEKLIKKYPGTKYIDTIDARRYAIAQYWLELTHKSPENMLSFNVTNPRLPWRDTRGHALRVYDKIRIDDPTGALADDATIAAGNAHFLAGNYYKADEYYGDLRKAFPASEHQFKAHFLGLKTKLINYQGSQYSGEALDEAEKLIKQMRKQFPREARDEHDFLVRAAAEVRFKKAQREWDMAQYYSRRGEYGAARLYQTTLVDEYEDTPFAERARKQLEDQRDEPAQPSKPVPWLTEMFPREQPAKPWFYSDAPPKK